MIDFHCHCDLYPDPAAVIAEAARRDLWILSVTTTPSAWNGTSQLAEAAPSVHTALGLHPQIAHERHSELTLFEQLLPKVRFVGEIGLDGSKALLPHLATQERVFRSILSLCAHGGGRVMSIHSRNAAGRVLDILEAIPAAGIPVLHWFSGTSRELDRAVALGCWFSVGSAMVAGEKGSSLVARMPPNRVLTETDGPFAKLGGRDLMPWDITAVLPRLAALWGVDSSAIGELIDQTHARLLKDSRCMGGAEDSSTS
jgi:TatD DNase family protein